MRKQLLVCWMMLLISAWGAYGQEPLAPLSTGAWTKAGELLTPRTYFTATLLNDGRILIAGGNTTANSTISAALSACELYDPKTRTCAPAAALQFARFNHAAIKLADGRVLVAGGSGPTGSLTSASNRQLRTCELFDPKSGSWSRTGDLVSSSTIHQLVMLDSGQVMKVCGTTRGATSGFLNEVYDPATGVWRQVKSSLIAHNDPFCVKLGDGRVLVSGGNSSNKWIEIYNPATDLWTTTTQMTHADRGGRGVQLSDGQVLLAGGDVDWSKSPALTTPLVDSFIPSKNVATAGPAMLNKRAYFPLLPLPGDYVLALGGRFYSSCATARCDLYDPTLKKWRTFPTLNAPRGRFEAVLAGGTLYAFGGLGDLEMGINNTSVNRVLGSIDALAFTAPGPVTLSAPIARTDQFEGPQGIKQLLRPLDNDWDPDCHVLSMISATHGKQGEVTLWYNTWAEQNVVYYEPFWSTWTGTDSFNYTIADNNGHTTVGTVNVTVTPANHKPLGANDYYIVMKDKPRTVAAPGVMTNDVDLDGQTTTVSLKKAPGYGQFSLKADGSFSYVPNAGFLGKDAFTYSLADASGNLAATATTVTLNVKTFNNPPSAYGSSQTVPVGTPFVVFSPSGYDLDGDPLSFNIVKQPAHGRLSGSNNRFRYHPDSGFTGTDAVQFKANDGLDNSTTATIAFTVQGSNKPPVAYDAYYSTGIGQPVTLLMNAYDPEGDPLTYIIIGQPLHGQISVKAPYVVYTPDPGYVGKDKVSFRVNDGHTDSNGAGLVIMVGPANRAPVAYNSSAAGDEDTLIPVPLSASDADNDPLTYRIVQAPMHGWLSGSGALLTYKPETNYNGTDSLIFRALDSLTSSSTATVSITVRPVNDLPFAYNRAVYGNEDSVQPITLFAVDAENDLLQYTVVTPPAHGRLSGSGKYLSYIPETNYNGTDRFWFKASDGQGDSNVATVYITLAPVNDAPVANYDSYSTNEDTALNIPAPGVMSNDRDVEGDPFKAVLVQGPRHGWVTLNADGSFRYVPETNYNYTAETTYGGYVPDSFIYLVRETSYQPETNYLPRPETSYLSSWPAVVRILVNPVNDPPVLKPLAVPAEPFPVGALVSLEGNFSDPDRGDRHTATWTWGDGATSDGTVDEATGKVTGAHTYAAPGFYAVTLAVQDQTSASATATCQDVIVYAPVADTITGGGWFNDSAGAGTVQMLARKVEPDKMVVDLNVRYRRSESFPSGLMSLSSQDGQFQFIADSFKCLVISGPKAVLMGRGTINGKAGYAFMANMFDGSSVAVKPRPADRIRVKIWEAQTGAVVYDTQPGAADDAEPTMELNRSNLAIREK